MEPFRNPILCLIALLQIELKIPVDCYIWVIELYEFK